MASLSMILSSSNFSSRSDVFGNKLFNGRSLAVKGTAREWDGSKRVMKEARVKAKMGGGGGGGGGGGLNSSISPILLVLFK